jgi:hypothetical protein
VDSTSPTVMITSPTNGQIITDTVYTILGSANDNLSGVDVVEVSTDGGSTWSQAPGTTSWSYIWNMPGEDNVAHVLRSRARDRAGNVEDSTTVTVTVDNVRPTSVINDPSAAQMLIGTTYVIRGTASDGSGIARVEVSTDGGTDWQTATGTTNWVYTWTWPSKGTYALLSRATDGVGNVQTPGSGVAVIAAYAIYLPAVLR